ncbi:hypothetical protein AB832_08050 [Flavobacteriaceae bacterium (ex Bugula neritina AB1)]|nr:hypothetical protein AB832_08050 [Flavobacteriaceae bacterium (ex Bugula neritina AB1)]
MHYLPKSIVFFLTLHALHATARQSANFSVTGTLNPTACGVSLSNGGVVDYGERVAANSNATEFNQLGSLTLEATFTCLSPTQVAMQITDNQANSSNVSITPLIDGGEAGGAPADDRFFGMGLAPNNEPIGNYVIAYTNGNADGSATDSIQSSNGRSSWISDGSGTAGPGGVSDLTQQTWPSSGAMAPLAVNNATMTLKISAAIDDMTTINAAADSIIFDGSSTLTLIYL